MRVVAAILLITSLMVSASAQDRALTSEQTQIIERARETALQYSANLPNFISTETIRRSTLGKGSRTWKLEDTSTVDVAYSDEGERYKTLTINGKPTTKNFHKLSGAKSNGEFGSMLQGIFQPESATKFRWERSEELRGRPTYVFSYSIDEKHSGYNVGVDKRQMIAAFEGFVYVDRETSHVLRLTHEPQGIPADWPLAAMWSDLDYGFAEIGGQRFLLPLHAALNLRWRNGGQARNTTDFHNYRKFTTEATLKFEP